MKIPKRAPRYKLPIKSVPWMIYIVNQAQFDKIHPELKNQKLCGLSDGNSHSIFILSEFPLHVVLQTTLHEIVHAILTDLDASKTVTKTGTVMIDEELVAESCAIGFLELATHLELLKTFLAKHVKGIEDDDDE